MRIMTGLTWGLWILLGFTSLTASQATWKGRVEKEGETKVLLNPPAPIYGEFKFELIEDLTIGREDNDQFLFNGVRQISIDGAGRFYIVDGRNKRVQVFDRTGRFVRTLGRAGQGPGEFQGPVETRFGPGGEVLIRDASRKIEVFDDNGHFIRSIPLRFTLLTFQYSIEGGLLGLVRAGTSGGSLQELVQLDASFQIKKTLFSVPYSPATRNEGGSSIFVDTGYEHKLLFGRRPNGFVLGHSSEYVISMLNERGDVLIKIKKDTRVPLIPAEIRQKYRDLPLPDHAPFYYSFLSDDQDRLYVVSEDEKSPGIKRLTADVFSRDGYYMYRVALPGRLQVFQDGFLYALMIDPQGLEQIKRYKIMNDRSMKTKVDECIP